MLHNISRLLGITVRATDGEVGKVDQFYFDDETWAIRYLVVATGDWLHDRPVLISPMALGHEAWKSKTLDVALTRSKIEGSPHIDTHKPVSRQHEADYFAYYEYPYYWGGSNVWGAGPYAMGAVMAREGAAGSPVAHTKPAKGSGDHHLRSTSEVKDYHVEANDGEIGHVEDFLVDDETWAIRYLAVNTHNWWPGKKVLVSPAWIEKVSWQESKVHVGLSKEIIRSGPAYSGSAPITRAFEAELYQHYRRQAYWADSAAKAQAPLQSKAS
jgi:sporulation protein YlmC with PRC-barrel domain